MQSIDYPQIAQNIDIMPRMNQISKCRICGQNDKDLLHCWVCLKSFHFNCINRSPFNSNPRWICNDCKPKIIIFHAIVEDLKKRFYPRSASDLVDCVNNALKQSNQKTSYSDLKVDRILRGLVNIPINFGIVPIGKLGLYIHENHVEQFQSSSQWIFIQITNFIYKLLWDSKKSSLTKNQILFMIHEKTSQPIPQNFLEIIQKALDQKTFFYSENVVMNHEIVKVYSILGKFRLFKPPKKVLKPFFIFYNEFPSTYTYSASLEASLITIANEVRFPLHVEYFVHLYNIFNFPLYQNKATIAPIHKTLLNSAYFYSIPDYPRVFHLIHLKNDKNLQFSSTPNAIKNANSHPDHPMLLTNGVRKILSLAPTNPKYSGPYTSKRPLLPHNKRLRYCGLCTSSFQKNLLFCVNCPIAFHQKCVKPTSKGDVSTLNNILECPFCKLPSSLIHQAPQSQVILSKSAALKAPFSKLSDPPYPMGLSFYKALNSETELSLEDLGES